MRLPNLLHECIYSLLKRPAVQRASKVITCESINGWIAIPMVRCGICAVSTLRMCFYACRISLISGLLNEDLICWVGS